MTSSPDAALRPEGLGLRLTGFRDNLQPSYRLTVLLSPGRSDSVAFPLPLFPTCSLAPSPGRTLKKRSVLGGSSSAPNLQDYARAHRKKFSAGSLSYKDAGFRSRRAGSSIVLGVASWLCGRVALRPRGSAASWFCGLVALRPRGSAASWLCGLVALRPRGSAASWLCGLVALRPRGSAASWLCGLVALRLPKLRVVVSAGSKTIFCVVCKVSD
ncbi:Inositol hexakisphosphate and diphosphoinositol-pentakisphosphate kinase 1 [Liparis tanakae]|uniref:Inositol hexakisphosphate and diphosphoinositol-pentakisphosphate kinase 1 n=1 Tax=Liparis tanakae TaxID=230148 RepID=A0A4Z2EVN6_9TELE|nr:Inositol hexakisphosphate and diphosphoinositol-pentakisphosphate kinase 1 [Liparis tanakae]